MLKDHAKEWQKLYFALADGKAADIEALKALDVFEFFSRLEIWEEAIAARLEALSK